MTTEQEAIIAKIGDYGRQVVAYLENQNLTASERTAEWRRLDAVRQPLYKEFNQLLARLRAEKKARRSSHP